MSDRTECVYSKLFNFGAVGYQFFDLCVFCMAAEYVEITKRD